MKTLKKVLFLLLILLLTACNDDSVAYTDFQSESMGISFEYPEAWVLDDNMLEVNVATDESLFTTSTADFSGGAVANVSTFPPEAMGSDVTTAVTQFAAFIGAGETAEQIGDVETLTINGHEAARASITLTAQTKMDITMIQGDEQIVLVAGVYDDEQYQPQLQHVAESLAFTP
jgi:hypothetical protein